MTNEELISQMKDMVHKGVTTTSAIATNGKLNAEQAERYIDYVIDLSMLKNNVRIVRFRPEQMEINKIGVGNRVTILASEANATAVRRGVTHTKITLQPVKLMTPFEISDEYLQFNLEGDRVEEHILRMMATQTMNDIEDLLLNANDDGYARLESDLFDSGSSTQYVLDSLMSSIDGWLRLADSGNVVDAAAANISLTFFSSMLNNMPTKFRRMPRDLRFLVSLYHEQLYREKVAAKGTALGDVASQGQIALTPFGVPLVGVPLLDSQPYVCENNTFGAAPDTFSTRYAPISSFIIVPQTIGATPTTPYVLTTDYTVNTTTGLVTTVAGAALNAGGATKMTYKSQGQMLLSNYQNMIFAIGKDISIESDRDIFKQTWEYAISTRVDAEIEEVTATVKGINVGLA
jgi:hypothetical protein